MTVRWLVLVLAAMGITPAAVASAVYKWVDQAGQVHYDDTRVADGQRLTRELLATRVVAPAADKGLTVPAEWVDLFAGQCDRAGSRIQTLRVATAVYGLSPRGHEFRYTDQQVRLMIVEARAEAAQHCPANAARDAYRDALSAARLRLAQETAHE